jgi:hypothetical protein
VLLKDHAILTRLLVLSDEIRIRNLPPGSEERAAFVLARQWRATRSRKAQRHDTLYQLIAKHTKRLGLQHSEPHSSVSAHSPRSTNDAPVKALARRMEAFEERIMTLLTKNAASSQPQESQELVATRDARDQARADADFYERRLRHLTEQFERYTELTEEELRALRRERAVETVESGSDRITNTFIL